MESIPNESGKNSPNKDSRAADELPFRNGSSGAMEVLRLQNVLKFKDKELEEARKEVTALKASLHCKDRALNQSDQELRLTKERYAVTEGELTNMAKELAVTKVDKRKLEAQLAGLVRKGEKEQPMPVLLAHKSSLVSLGSVEGDAFGSVPGLDHVASLQADLRHAKQDGEKAAESVRVLENLLRSKDKKIHSLQRKLEDVELYKTKCVDLENRVSDLLRQLENERSSCRTSADVLRMSDAEKVKLAADLVKSRAALEAAQEMAARSSAALKASETKCSALESEVGVLAGQLARTSAVAKRVAVAEVRAGCKDEGVVHVTRHVEEVRFMGGEILRLQQRIAALEKQLVVSDELKDRYRRMSQPGTPRGNSPPGNSLQSSPLGSPAGTGLTPRTVFRPSSARPAIRPMSAPRRSITAGAAAAASSPIRPKSAPRPGSAVRRNRKISSGGDATATSNGAGSSTSPRPGFRAGKTAATTAAGGATRVTVSPGARRQLKQMPWNFNPKSPVKLAAVAATEASGSPGAAAEGAQASSQQRVGSATKGGVVKATRPGTAKARAVAAAAALKREASTSGASGAADRPAEGAEPAASSAEQQQSAQVETAAS